MKGARLIFASLGVKELQTPGPREILIRTEVTLASPGTAGASQSVRFYDGSPNHSAAAVAQISLPVLASTASAVLLTVKPAARI